MTTPGGKPGRAGGDTIAAARRACRSFHTGALVFGERVSPVRWAPDPAGRSFIAPIDPAAEDAEDLFIVAPSESRREVEILLHRPERIDPTHEPVCDRWAAYHREARYSVWARLTGMVVRYAGVIEDAEDVLTPNPWAGVEGAVRRAINADREALLEAVRRGIDSTLDEALLVGADPDGLDIRGPARVGVLRVAFPFTADEDITGDDAVALAKRTLNLPA